MLSCQHSRLDASWWSEATGARSPWPRGGGATQLRLRWVTRDQADLGVGQRRTEQLSGGRGESGPGAPCAALPHAAALSPTCSQDTALPGSEPTPESPAVPGVGVLGGKHTSDLRLACKAQSSHCLHNYALWPTARPRRTCLNGLC